MEAIVQFGHAHPQPAAPHHHVLDPAEVTIRKRGTVTFQVNGGARRGDLRGRGKNDP
jgi:hypothetical protein